VRHVESQFYDIRGINRVILSLAIFTVVLTAAVGGLIRRNVQQRSTRPT
jgi:hypothetical protein